MEQKVNWFRRVTDLFILSDPNIIKSWKLLVFQEGYLAEDAGQAELDFKNLKWLISNVCK